GGAGRGGGGVGGGVRGRGGGGGRRRGGKGGGGKGRPKWWLRAPAPAPPCPRVMRSRPRGHGGASVVPNRRQFGRLCPPYAVAGWSPHDRPRHRDDVRRDRGGTGGAPPAWTRPHPVQRGAVADRRPRGVRRRGAGDRGARPRRGARCADQPGDARGG